MKDPKIVGNARSLNLDKEVTNMNHTRKYSAKSHELILQVKSRRQAVLDELNGCESLDRYRILVKELKMCNKLLNNTTNLLKTEIINNL